MEAASELQREIEWSMVPLAVGDTCVSDLPRAAPLAIPVTHSGHASAALPVYTAIPAPPMAPLPPAPARGLFGKLKSSVRSALGRADPAAEPVSYYRTPAATSAAPTGYAAVPAVPAVPAVYAPASGSGLSSGPGGGIPQSANREGGMGGEARAGIPVLKSSKASSAAARPAVGVGKGGELQNLVLQRQHERLDEETVRRFWMSGN